MHVCGRAFPGQPTAGHETCSGRIGARNWMQECRLPRIASRQQLNRLPGDSVTPSPIFSPLATFSAGFLRCFLSLARCFAVAMVSKFFGRERFERFSCNSERSYAVQKRVHLSISEEAGNCLRPRNSELNMPRQRSRAPGPVHLVRKVCAR